MATVIPERFWMRRGVYADLVEENELLYKGEFCVELLDADGYESMRFKIGNEAGDHWRDMLWAGWGLIDLSALANGHVPVYDAARRCWGTSSTSGGGQVPTRIAAGDSYTVLEDHQVLFRRPIVVEGALIINGELIEI